MKYFYQMSEDRPISATRPCPGCAIKVHLHSAYVSRRRGSESPQGWTTDDYFVCPHCNALMRLGDDSSLRIEPDWSDERKQKDRTGTWCSIFIRRLNNIAARKNVLKPGYDPCNEWDRQTLPHPLKTNG